MPRYSLVLSISGFQPMSKNGAAASVREELDGGEKHKAGM